MEPTAETAQEIWEIYSQMNDKRKNRGDFSSTVGIFWICRLENTSEK
jgi:hypothetical protein